MSRRTASYRVSVCSASSLAPNSRVLVAARGSNGYTLPVSQLLPGRPSAGAHFSADSVESVVVHTLAEGGCALTHLEMWSEAGDGKDWQDSGSGKKAGAFASLLGSKAGAAKEAPAGWRVRWVSVEELGESLSVSDDESDDSDSEGDRGGRDRARRDADAGRPASRSFFFPVEQLVPRAAAGAGARQKLTVAEATAGGAGRPSQCADAAALLYPLVAQLRAQAEAARRDTSVARDALNSAQKKLAAATAAASDAAAAAKRAAPPPPQTPQTPAPLPLPMPPHPAKPPVPPLHAPLPPPAAAAAPLPLPVHPGALARADAEARSAAAGEARALACCARLTLRRRLRLLRAWRAHALSSRALHVAWLRCAQRVVRRLGSRCLHAWAQAARQSAAERDGTPAFRAAQHRERAACTRALGLSMRLQQRLLVSWRSWAARRAALNRLLAKHLARTQLRRPFTALRMHAQRQRAVQRTLQAAWARRSRRCLLSALRAWAASAQQETTDRRLQSYVPVSQALALLARRPPPVDGSPLGVLSRACAAWRRAARLRSRARFLVRRCEQRRRGATSRAVLAAWLCQVQESRFARGEWSAKQAKEHRARLCAVMAAWSAVAAAEKHSRRWCLRRGLAEWRFFAAQERAARMQTSLAQMSLGGCFRGWRVVTLRMQLQQALEKVAADDVAVVPRAMVAPLLMAVAG